MTKYFGDPNGEDAEKTNQKLEDILMRIGETAFVNEKKGVVAPKRPAGVPAEAIWNEKEGEWELGESNKHGRIGEWKWWIPPNYNLRCHTFYNDTAQMISATRYHPNGEVALELSYNDKGNALYIYHKSCLLYTSPSPRD